MAIPSADRKFREHAPIESMTERELVEAISEALIIDFGKFRSTHKEIARAAGAASEKTAENWTHGRGAPSLLYGLRLMAKSKTLAKEILRLCALEADSDPEFQAEFIKFMQRMGNG